MILAREVTRPDGSKALQRMVFKNFKADAFDWSWEGSKGRWQDLAGSLAHPLSAKKIGQFFAKKMRRAAAQGNLASMAPGVDRRTVDLSGFPDLVVIYLGMRVNRLTGIKTLLGFGPRISSSAAAHPTGPFVA